MLEEKIEIDNVRRERMKRREEKANDGMREEIETINE